MKENEDVLEGEGALRISFILLTYFY